MRRLVPALLLIAISAVAAHAVAHSKPQVIETANGDNRPEQSAKHYVVLVSIDGFRYDYAKLYGAPHLNAIAKEGASAPDGMVPSYPSVTFPNHYTLVTGLYPEHHGIVAMSFYDPARKERYAFNDPKTVTDGSWYRGVPLWSLAEKQGMRAACFFWPGSEAEIAGARPSYYLKYDDAVPDEERVDQVVDWLKLPAAKRPHFITLYFAEVDHAGHEYGPDAPETRAAVRHVDSEIGTLRSHLAKLHLPIDLIVVSDHGMAPSAWDQVLTGSQRAGSSPMRSSLPSHLNWCSSRPVALFTNPGVSALHFAQFISITDDQFFFSYFVCTWPRNFFSSLGTCMCLTTCTAYRSSRTFQSWAMSSRISMSQSMKTAQPS